MTNPETITLTIPKPGPGELIETTVDGIEILAQLDQAQEDPHLEDPEPPAVGREQDGYTPCYAKAPTSDVIHATELWRYASGRKRRGKWTLCASGRSEKFLAKENRLNAPMHTVTCTRCRHRLEDEGVL